MSDANDKPAEANVTPSTSPATEQADDAASSRRQFVFRMTRRAAYVAPIVIALAATRTASASSPSGAPS
ncbi:MAG: hypothetical protein IT440_08665 [Phycisphaeraceae bacterium]|nr:hypothetical protein [Phycisphaeraceae bacterium]